MFSACLFACLLVLPIETMFQSVPQPFSHTSESSMCLFNPFITVSTIPILLASSLLSSDSSACYFLSFRVFCDTIKRKCFECTVSAFAYFSVVNVPKYGIHNGAYNTYFSCGTPGFVWALLSHGLKKLRYLVTVTIFQWKCIHYAEAVLACLFIINILGQCGHNSASYASFFVRIPTLTFRKNGNEYTYIYLSACCAKFVTVSYTKDTKDTPAAFVHFFTVYVCVHRFYNDLNRSDALCDCFVVIYCLLSRKQCFL